jgi:DNA-binding MarR family transcriptional regulator
MKHGNPYNAGADARAVLDAIRRIVQVLRVGSRAAEREVGLSAAQLFVLDRLASSDRPLSVNELAERTLTHQSSVSVVVRKLERLRLIERTAAADDARRAQLAITRAARKLLRNAPRAAQDRILDALAAMPAGQRRRLAGLLGELVSRFGEPGEAPPAMFFEDQPTKNAKPAQKRKRRARS